MIKPFVRKQVFSHQYVLFISALMAFILSGNIYYQTGVSKCRYPSYFLLEKPTGPSVDGYTTFFKEVEITGKTETGFKASFSHSTVEFLTEENPYSPGDKVQVRAKYNEEGKTFSVLGAAHTGVMRGVYYGSFVFVLFIISTMGNNSLLKITRFVMFPHLCILLLHYFWGASYCFIDHVMTITGLFFLSLFLSSFERSFLVSIPFIIIGVASNYIISLYLDPAFYLI